MTETIENPITGLHFSAGTATELADRTCRAWANQPALSDMGQSAKREFEQKYNASRNQEILIGI